VSSDAAPADVDARLAEFLTLLRRWNQKINLVSRADEPFLQERHIDDSLQLAELIDPTWTTAIDLGSGAGFPGLVLAIATGVRFALVEADHRKAAFLREAARVTETDVEVRAVRMQALTGLAAPLVTARALASVTDLLPVLHGLIEPGGAALLLKGEAVDVELTDLPPEWQMRVERHPSCTRRGSSVLKLSDIVRRPPSGRPDGF
jgi:16S rRNA (guanine527-N7)-methyltransferase